ncbi:MaoC family dehydratase [Streptomyces sp. NPDC044780]|uniref:MaoC family dehydratase n=1 Tax=unclassified Streptomyces TaxID=2593676 RepID=UPI0034036192
MNSDAPTARCDRYLEDYRPGESHDCGSVTVTEEEIVEFATRFDPQFFHVDPEAAADGPFGGLIASGWHTTALMMRLYADHYLSPAASLGGPGVDELRWTAPVRPGDTLRLRVTVLEARPSRSKPDRGILRSRVEMTNQRQETVLRLTVLNMLRVRPADSG